MHYRPNETPRLIKVLLPYVASFCLALDSSLEPDYGQNLENISLRIPGLLRTLVRDGCIRIL